MRARGNAVKKLGGRAEAPPIDAAASKTLAAPALDDATLTKIFSAKTWQARQGPWLATLEFRGDGTFRQRSKDASEGSTLEVVWERNARGVSRGTLCIFTNVELCLAAHEADGNIVLARTGQTDKSSEPVVEYFGSASGFKDLSTNAVFRPGRRIRWWRFCCPDRRG